MIKGILVCGKMYSGKTSLADHLVHKFEYKKYSMARSLKELVGGRYNKGEYVNKGDVYATEMLTIEGHTRRNTLSGRQLLQEVSEAIKSVDYSFFYGYEAEKIKQELSEGDCFVIDDCRFLPEYQYFKREFNIKVVYVDVSKEERIKRAKAKDNIDLTDNVLNAPSEQLDWAESVADLIIYNEEMTLLEAKELVEMVL